MNIPLSRVTRRIDSSQRRVQITRKPWYPRRCAPTGCAVIVEAGATARCAVGPSLPASLPHLGPENSIPRGPKLDNDRKAKEHARQCLWPDLRRSPGLETTQSELCPFLQALDRDTLSRLVSPNLPLSVRGFSQQNDTITPPLGRADGSNMPPDRKQPSLAWGWSSRIAQRGWSGMSV